MTWTLEHGMSVRRSGSGPEVVWIHGLGEAAANFEPNAAHPALSGFEHVLLDLPGYGRSPWPDQLDDLARSADRLAAWIANRRPALIGHSMGGMLATLIAERTPVRCVVNVDGNLTRGDCTFSADVLPYSSDDFEAHGFAALRANAYERGRSEPALRGYYAAMCFASPRVFHHHAVDLVALSESETLAGRLAKLAAPVLFVAGGVVGGICARSRAELDRLGVRWIGIEPGGHWVHSDQPDAFAARVGAFLRET